MVLSSLTDGGDGETVFSGEMPQAVPAGQRAAPECTRARRRCGNESEPRGRLSTIATTIFTDLRRFDTDMKNIRDSLSRARKDVRQRLRGRRDKPDGTEDDAASERVDSPGPPPRPESRLDPDVEPAIDVAPEREVERVYLSPSTASIPPDGKRGGA